MTLFDAVKCTIAFWLTSLAMLCLALFLAALLTTSFGHVLAAALQGQL